MERRAWEWLGNRKEWPGVWPVNEMKGNGCRRSVRVWDSVEWVVVVVVVEKIEEEV